MQRTTDSVLLVQGRAVVEFERSVGWASTVAKAVALDEVDLVVLGPSVSEVLDHTLVGPDVSER